MQHFSSSLIVRSTRLSTALMGVLMVVMVSISSMPAFGQDALRPPKTDTPASGPKYLVYLVAILLLAGVVFAVTLKTKRSHQD